MIMRQIYRAIEATNTKTRRLAYLSAIVEVLRNEAFTERALLEKLNKWNLENRSFLEEHITATGEITSTSKNSAGMRYIELAKKLGLISTIAGMYRTTRLGSVLQELLRKKTVAGGPFALSLEEKMFFTYLLLKEDGDIFLTIARRIIEEDKISLSSLQKKFQDDFISRLDLKIVAISEDIYKQQILERRNVVTNEWKNPQRYAEHIVPPRINWMVDLDLLDKTAFSNHVCSFSDKGKKIFSSIPYENNLLDVSDEWIEDDLWNSLASSFVGEEDILDWEKLDSETQVNSIKNLIQEAFLIFQTSQLPRISIKQAALYICIMLLTKEKVIVSPKGLTSWLSTPRIIDNKKYEVRLSPRENESYLLASIV